MFGELAVVRAELVRISRWSCEVRDGLAIVPATQRRAAFTGTTGDHRCETCVVSAGPHYRLAQPRDAQDRDALCIHGAVGFQVVQPATESPSPSGNSAPLVRSRCRIQCPYAVRQAACKVPVDVAVVNCCEAEPGVEQSGHVDLSKTSALAGRDFLLVWAPDFTFFDRRVVYGVRVCRETQVQQEGYRLRGACRNVDQYIHLRSGLIG